MMTSLTSVSHGYQSRHRHRSHFSIVRLPWYFSHRIFIWDVKTLWNRWRRAFDGAAAELEVALSLQQREEAGEQLIDSCTIDSSRSRPLARLDSYLDPL